MMKKNQVSRREKVKNLFEKHNNYVVIGCNDLVDDLSIKLKNDAKKFGLKCSMCVKRFFHSLFFEKREKNGKLDYVKKHLYIVYANDESFSFYDFLRAGNKFGAKPIGAVVENKFFKDYKFAVSCNYSKQVLLAMIVRILVTYHVRVLYPLFYKQQ